MATAATATAQASSTPPFDVGFDGRACAVCCVCNTAVMETHYTHPSYLNFRLAKWKFPYLLQLKCKVLTCSLPLKWPLSNQFRTVFSLCSVNFQPFWIDVILLMYTFVCWIWFEPISHSFSIWLQSIFVSIVAIQCIHKLCSNVRLNFMHTTTYKWIYFNQSHWNHSIGI